LRRGWRLGLFLLPVCAAGWAAGCSDDSGVTPSDTTDGGPGGPDGTSGDGSPSGPKRDCTGDLDAGDVWQHLECTGLYKDFQSKTLADEVKAYKPGVEFWSDGAEKSRWVYLPPGTKIDVSNWDEWVYPVGTLLWKEFKLNGKRVETRLFRKIDTLNWGHTSYRWTDDETDAVRKDTGEKIDGGGPDGGLYEIPDQGTCNSCHDGRKDHVLGFEPVNLGIASATGETLAKLASDGLLSAAPPKTTLAFPGDDKAVPAVGWLHANCGACHNGNPISLAQDRAHFLVKASQLAPADGGAPATLQELDVWTSGYCKPTGRTDIEAGAPWYYIRGGNPAKSEMSVLSGYRVPPPDPPDSRQMPPIVTHAVDTKGHQLLDDWITSLPACP
jgi:hypothetical protein